MGLDHQKVIGYICDNEVIGFALLSEKAIGATSTLASLGLRLNSIRFLFEPGKIYLGFVQALKQYPLQQDSIEISYLAVLPNYQGMGIGANIIKNLSKFIPAEKKYIQTKTNNQRLRDYYVNECNAEVLDEYVVLRKRYSVIRWPVNN